MEEDVGGFDIAVQDLAVVNVLDCTAQLDEPVPDDIFTEEALAFLHFFYLMCQISAVTVVLYDA